MFSKTNLKIAMVHLTSRKRQSIIAVLSVTFGVGLFIFMNSFIGGINQLQADLVFSTMAHIRIFNEVNTEVPPIAPHAGIVQVRNAKAIQYTEGIRNADKIVKDLENTPSLVGITTQVNMSGTFKNGAAKLGGVISGVDVEKENQLFNMDKYVVEGRWEDLAYSNNHIIIGVGMAKKLSLVLGSNISVTTAEGVNKSFKIVGLVFAGTPSVDDNKGYIRKSAALQLQAKNKSYASDIQINIKDYAQAEAVAATLKEAIPYKVQSWQEANEQLVAGNSLRNAIGTVVPLVLIIVAGFGIYNIMTMTVNEKIKEIAILKALGFGGRDVVEIFLTQALVIGLFGGLTGMMLGFGIAKAVGKMPFKMATSDHLLMLFEPRTYAVAFSIGLIITLIAGYLPARKASSVDPVQIIRG